MWSSLYLLIGGRLARNGFLKSETGPLNAFTGDHGADVIAVGCYGVPPRPSYRVPSEVGTQVDEDHPEDTDQIRGSSGTADWVSPFSARDGVTGRCLGPARCEIEPRGHGDSGRSAVPKVMVRFTGGDRLETFHAPAFPIVPPFPGAGGTARAEKHPARPKRASAGFATHSSRRIGDPGDRSEDHSV